MDGRDKDHQKTPKVEEEDITKGENCNREFLKSN